MWFNMFWAVPGAAVGRRWGSSSPAQHMGAPVTPSYCRGSLTQLPFIPQELLFGTNLPHSLWLRVLSVAKINLQHGSSISKPPARVVLVPDLHLLSPDPSKA